jgi:hypothetical protein
LISNATFVPLFPESFYIATASSFRVSGALTLYRLAAYSGCPAACLNAFLT